MRQRSGAGVDLGRSNNLQAGIGRTDGHTVPTMPAPACLFADGGIAFLYRGWFVTW
jgi:hypothetical protein